jgi:L-methionine (R)-S-oxide reductase
VSEDNNKPAFDEQTLAKLLEAAYVLQQQNRDQRKREMKLELNLEMQRNQVQAQQTSSPTQTKAGTRGDDYTFTLAQIVQTQHQIQATQLELADAISLVAQRVVEIAHAGGAAVGLLEGKKIRYRASYGQMVPADGSEVPMEKALCVASLRTGQVVRCADVNAEFLLDVEECQRRGIHSLIAVPIYRDESVTGGLELYYGSPHSFTEQDVHTCQLMAGLITEVLARDEEIALKKSLAAERAVMLEALEKLKPNLAALADAQAAGLSAQKPAATGGFECRKCGHRLMAEEQFCGKCGTPRSGDYEPSSMQSKLATFWEMQESSKKEVAPEHVEASPEIPTAPEFSPEKPLSNSIEEELPEFFRPPELHEQEAHESFSHDGALSQPDEKPAVTVSDEESETEVEATGETALVTTNRAWSSAASARDFLEQLASGERQGGLARFWASRRGDIYLAIAVLFVAIVLRWGIWSDHSVDATGGAGAAHHRIDPNADLSWFDRMLVSFGLAEAPPAPDNKGNPDTQVWVDLHTALYYCPGAELYGKTPKGKYTSQRDAQLDQFEPASRKACD